MVWKSLGHLVRLCSGHTMSWSEVEPDLVFWSCPYRDSLSVVSFQREMKQLCGEVPPPLLVLHEQPRQGQVKLQACLCHTLPFRTLLWDLLAQYGWQERARTSANSCCPQMVAWLWTLVVDHPIIFSFVKQTLNRLCGSCPVTGHDGHASLRFSAFWTESGCKYPGDRGVKLLIPQGFSLRAATVVWC